MSSAAALPQPLISPSSPSLSSLPSPSLPTGQLLIRRVFEFVAESRSTEAFVAAILLTATASSYATSSLGFSDSLGAFVAGVVLAETNYRTQIEADIKPFKGLLLGLFFVATGSSIDSTLLINDWPTVLILLTGLILVKSVITGVLAPFFGLNRSESLRIALTLSQGGEFAFVLLTLANQLNLLPGYLTRMLIIVVGESFHVKGSDVRDLFGAKLVLGARFS